MPIRRKAFQNAMNRDRCSQGLEAASRSLILKELKKWIDFYNILLDLHKMLESHVRTAHIGPISSKALLHSARTRFCANMRLKFAVR